MSKAAAAIGAAMSLMTSFALLHWVDIAAAQAPPAVETPKLAVLAEPRVQSFLTAMKELRALGTQDEVWSKARSGTAANFTKATPISGDALSIVQKNGFSNAAEFQAVGYNAAMAYSVVKEGGKPKVQERLHKAEAEQAKVAAELARQLGPEQVAVMTAQLSGGIASRRGLLAVPDENVALITKYRQQMQELDTRK